MQVATRNRTRSPQTGQPKKKPCTDQKQSESMEQWNWGGPMSWAATWTLLEDTWKHPQGCRSHHSPVQKRQLHGPYPWGDLLSLATTMTHSLGTIMLYIYSICLHWQCCQHRWLSKCSLSPGKSNLEYSIYPCRQMLTYIRVDVELLKCIGAGWSLLAPSPFM